MFIPCQTCKILLPKDWNWFVCDGCGKRICMNCLGQNGYKCGDCAFGYYQEIMR